MQNEKIKAWVTNCALEYGIIKISGTELSEYGELLYIGPVTGMVTFQAEDWHRTPESAIARAEEMRAAKIASLEKQIERLRKLEFKV